MTGLFDWEQFYHIRAKGKSYEILSFFTDLATVEFAGLGRQTLHLSMFPDDERSSLTKRLASEFMIAFRWNSYEVVSFVQQGNQAFARLDVELYFRKHQTSARMDLCHHFRFDGYRINAFTEFSDTAALTQLVNPPEPFGMYDERVAFVG